LQQLHKDIETEQDCSRKTLEFNLSHLETSFETTGLAIWTREPPYRVPDKGTSYMAVSHVWSDGTGIGVKAPGSVDAFLFRYMAKIAKWEGCEAIWWYTISIPEEETARRKPPTTCT
jgi:hypothetical protein